MINSICFIQQSQKYSFNKYNQAIGFNNNSKIKVSDSNVSQKPLSINNISFRQNHNANFNISDITPVHQKNDSFLFETKYSFEAENLKDLYIALYTNDLIMLLTPYFHTEQSNITGFKPSNSSEKKQNFHTLIISTSNEKINNKNEIINKQQEVLKDLYDTNFEQILNEIKEYCTELIKEDDSLDEFEKQERIDITNSINVKDVRLYMKKYLLDKKPIIKDMGGNND